MGAVRCSFGQQSSSHCADVDFENNVFDSCEMNERRLVWD